MDLLPSTTYQSPPRAGRTRRLNTILESEEMSAIRSDSEGDESDQTIIGRPIGLDQKLFIAASRSQNKASNIAAANQSRPVAMSPESSAGSGYSRRVSRGSSLRYSYTGSEDGTIISDDECPSLTSSNASESNTMSSRNSVASNRTGRRQYPPIFIPQESWHSMESPVKDMAMEMSPMSPINKIQLSQDVLSRLPQSVPAINAPPSLGDSCSAASCSPIVAISSAPPTPDMHNLEIAEGESWGGGATLPALNTALAIAIDEHSAMIIASEPYSANRRQSGLSNTEWNDIFGNFPTVPGATPVMQTPVTPNVDRFRGFPCASSDRGVQLPSGAMSVLDSLTRTYDSESTSEATAVEAEEEMKEREFEPPSRPRSADRFTPALSEYSISELSIPSPGGFFNSLQTNIRHTWCVPRAAATPTSAIAEGFYNVPWRDSAPITERILELPENELEDGELTARNGVEGPPTARKVGFEVSASDGDSTKDVVEDDDMYGPSSSHPSTQPVDAFEGLSYEYDETYESTIQQTATVNIDRTSDWLSAQTTYLSALRETNPLNDPADHPLSTQPLQDERNELAEAETEKAASFLERASKVSTANSQSLFSPQADGTDKEELFLAAFKHHQSQRNSQDAFLQASSRLDSVNANRIALPERHVAALLNKHTSHSLSTHKRPRYRGPFNQNPRATGVFGRTAEQTMYADAERKQLAMEQIQLNIWSTEAQQKVLFGGGLFACNEAAEKLARKATKQNSSGVPSKRKLRILDLAGAATASWAWAAAEKWPTAKVYTVQSQKQASLDVPSSSTSEATDQSKPNDQTKSTKPANPSNHHVLTVPQFWQLPFSSDYFDVISARNLHMFLRSKPVPGVASIDEWDLTLKECMRVLKPGGVLDFFLLDSSVAANREESTQNHKRGASNVSRLSINTNLSSTAAGHTTANISPSVAVGQSGSNRLSSLAIPQASRSEAVSVEFGFELKRRGYDRDGGCNRLMSRLKKEGFVGIKRQWVGLPMGRAGPTHSDPAAVEEGITRVENAHGIDILKSPATAEFGRFVRDAHLTRRDPQFPLAPRPLSEVSSISRIIDQYSNVEAVQGPVGSTADVADMAGLLGGVMWEEWLVRLRLEMGKTDTNKLLEGVNEVLSEGWMKGASWRGMVGWAKKPRKSSASSKSKKSSIAASSEVPITIDTTVIQNTQGSHGAVPLGFGSMPSTTGPSQQRPRRADHPNMAMTLTLDTKNLDKGANLTPLAGWTTAQMTSRANRTHNVYRKDPQQTTQVPATEAPAANSNKDRDSSMMIAPNSSGSYTTMDFTFSAVERGEVGTIPMMILE